MTECKRRLAKYFQDSFATSRRQINNSIARRIIYKKRETVSSCYLFLVGGVKDLDIFFDAFTCWLPDTV